MNQPPNILILFTDMQRADTIGALGNPTIRTPHLDRLVAEGAAFTNCFSPSPVCVPARCCMHYGMYPQKTGLADNGSMMPDTGNAYPALLTRHGYRTHAIGKCHFTPEPDALRGLQSRQSQEECTSDPDSDDYIAWLKTNGHDFYEPHGARGEMYYIPQVSTLPADAHPSQWIGSQSDQFIRESSNRDQPWCLFASFIHPHPPFAPPKPWHKLYRAPDMPPPFVPPNSADLHTWINRRQNRYKYRDRGLDLNLLRVIKAYYYATISFIDFQIGRILHALQQTDQLDNTLILFASDHGEYLGDFACFGKRGMHDAAARVPMLVRYPERFPAATRCAAAASLCDVFPTVISAAGIAPVDLPLDGLDLAQLIAQPDPQRSVYSQFSTGATALYMAVNERSKYVYSVGDDIEFLFDRRADPAEVNNLAAPGQPSDAAEPHRQDLLQFLLSVGAAEAVAPHAGRLDWRRFPRIDESYLNQPDAGLIVQDYPSYPTHLPGYTDAELQ